MLKWNASETKQSLGCITVVRISYVVSLLRWDPKVCDLDDYFQKRMRGHADSCLIFPWLIFRFFFQVM